MSNSWAISAVTVAFRHLLSRTSKEVTGTKVSTDHPSKSQTAPCLNLYLYRVTPNAAFTNANLPFRNRAGELVGQPVLPLNLHYLLTAHGNLPESELAGTTCWRTP